MMKNLSLTILAVVLMVVVVGCPRPPTKEMAEARAALDSAKDAGAPTLAQEEFRSAEQMLAEATAYMDEKKYDDARNSALTSKKLSEIARDKALKRRAPGKGQAGEGVTPEGETGAGVIPGQAVVTGKGSLGEGVTIKELEPVYFAFDDYSISEEAKDILKVNAGWLEKNENVKVQIEGHCDERGSAEYNIALGERRAKSARNYMIQLGIDPSKLSTISYGKERPVDPGHNEDAWVKNRRDEFVVK